MEKRVGKVGPVLPSPAMLVALLALFVAMGGSAWAVSKVGTKQIKNNAVTGSKIKNGAVTNKKIKSGAVNATRLASRAVTGVKLAAGAVTGTKLGVQSVGTAALADSAVTAAKLADGAVGGSNVSITTVNGEPVTIQVGTSEIVMASCPEGKTAVSAGYQANTGEVFVYQDFVSGGTALIYAASPAGSLNPVQVTAQAVCI